MMSQISFLFLTLLFSLTSDGVQRPACRRQTDAAAASCFSGFISLNCRVLISRAETVAQIEATSSQ